MAYVGEARWRFKGSQLACDPYVPVARVLVERVMAMYQVGQAVSMATHTERLRNGTVIRLTVFADHPPIITITPIAEPAEGGPHDFYPLCFTGSQDANVTAAAPWYSSEERTGNVDDVIDGPDTVWVRYQHGNYSTRPCGNMTWFPSHPANELPPLIVSWVGPPNRCFSDPNSGTVPATGSTIWVSDYSKLVPLRLVSTGEPVIAAWISGGVLSYVGLTSQVSPVEFARYDQETVNGTKVWTEQWRITLDAGYDELKTHLMVNPGATEGRCLVTKTLADYAQTWSGDGATWYSRGTKCHEEIVVDLVNGTHTVDWDDVTDHPYVRFDWEDSCDDSTGPEGYRYYFQKSGTITAGVPTSLDVGYYSGYSIAASPERKQMPFVGETYRIGNSTFTVDSVTVTDPMPRSDQEELDLQLVETTYTQEQLDDWVYPPDKSTAPFRGDGTSYGYGATINITWVEIETDENNDPVTYNDNEQITYLNTTGSWAFRWDRKVAATAHGKFICSVDYERDGTVVKAFIEPDVGQLFHMRVQVNEACPDFSSYSLPFMTGRYASIPYDYTWPTEPATNIPDAGHNGITGGWLATAIRCWLVIEGGRSSGIRIPIAGVSNTSSDYRQSVNWTTTADAGRLSGWDYDDEWTSSYRDITVTSGWMPEDIADYQAMTYSNIPDQHQDAAPVIYVAHLDLRYLTVFIHNDSTQLYPYADERTSSAGAIGTYGVAEPENVTGAVGFGAPDYGGFDRMAVATAVLTQTNKTHRWFPVRWRVVSHRKDLHQFAGDADTLADGTNAHQVVGVRGVRGFLANSGAAGGHLLSTAMLSTQSGTKVWREYTTNSNLFLGYFVHRDDYSVEGRLATSPYGTFLATGDADWKDEIPVGKSNVTATNQLLFGDMYDLTLAWSPGGAYSTTEAEWVTIFGATQDDASYATTIYYGGKPPIQDRS